MTNDLTTTSDLLLSLQPDDASIGTARVTLDAWLRRRPAATAEVRMDLAVVASELLANAYRACVGADTEVTLQCAHHQGAIVLAVTNPVSEWVAPADRWDFEDPLRTGGRGLLIVSALVDDLRVEHDLNRRCTVVTVKRSLDQADHDEQAEIDQIAEIEPEPRL